MAEGKKIDNSNTMRNFVIFAIGQGQGLNTRPVALGRGPVLSIYKI